MRGARASAMAAGPDRGRRRLLAAATAGTAAFAARPARADVPLVAAASDLKFALTEIAERFAREGGGRVELAFGSSGNFARQIQGGAPFQAFFSADEDFVFRLADAGLTRDRGALYAIGRLALLAPRGSKIRLDERLEGVREALPSIRRFAIANPEHAPYGRAGREALRATGLWDAVQPKLVLGENVSQAAQYVASGAAQAGLAAYSVAVADALRASCAHLLLPESLHAPLRQRVVLLRGASPVAAAFVDYVGRPAAREILRRFGFTLP